MTSSTDFWSEDLQSSIQTAGQQAKTLLCFVTDGSETSAEWSTIVGSDSYLESIQASNICLLIRKNTQEFGFLDGVCPIKSIPALVWIKTGQIEEKLESSHVSTDILRQKLTERYARLDTQEAEEPPAAEVYEEQCLEFGSTAGRMRLPNNAYEALKERTDKLRSSKISPKNILQVQLRQLNNLPVMKQYVAEIKSRPKGTQPKLPEDAINCLLNTSAMLLEPRKDVLPETAPSESNAATPASTTRSSIPAEPNLSRVSTPETTTTTTQQTQPSNQQSQQATYRRQQREREGAQRAERERIKAQIQSDREERRRLDLIRKQGELSSLRKENSTTPNPKSSDIRIQVRTFDGSTLRNTFTNTGTISRDVRPWIDETNPDAKKVPYNLKLILTPLPNRNIEASEEEQVLPDIGIRGSATLIMVPVAGYVDSYAEGSGGVAGSLIGGLVGAGGTVVNGVLGMLGWGSTPTNAQQAQGAGRNNATASDSSEGGTGSSGGSVKVRTLADQRAEEARRRGNQLYNGNSLDFQGKRDDDDNRKRD